MDRRKFLAAIGIVPESLRAITTSSKTKPSKWNICSWNQNWRVLWTGWKTQVNSIDLVGQCVAIPMLDDCSSPDRSRWVLCVSLPGGPQIVDRGEEIGTLFHSHMPLGTFGAELLVGEEGTLASLEAAAMIGLECLVSLVTSQEWKRESYFKPPLFTETSWKLLNDRTKWWLNPDKYCLENTGIPLEKLPDEEQYRLVRRFGNFQEVA